MICERNLTCNRMKEKSIENALNYLLRIKCSKLCSHICTYGSYYSRFNADIKKKDLCSTSESDHKDFAL